MVKFVAILSLILSLIAPHGVSAHSYGHVHEHKNTEAHHSAAVEDVDRHNTEDRHCCDAVVGSCGVAVLDSCSVAWTNASLRTADRIVPPGVQRGGVDLSFDPPPPRV